MGYQSYPTRSARRNYFLLPNEIFDLGLTVDEIATYAYLLRCENRETYQCHPGAKTIGKAINRSKNSVLKYLHSMEEKHLIYTEPTTVWGKDGKKRNGNLLITIRPIEEAKQYFVQCQIEENRRKKLRKLHKGVIYECPIFLQE